jgi:hypothetical protein
VNLTISSDPGELKTMKEELLGPEKEIWKEAIKKEITNFMSRGVWKPVSRKMETEKMNKININKTGYLRRRQNKITPSDTRQESYPEVLCRFQE